MARWQPDARERLEKAALELFTEQGFAETTVPQITARAGLTTRTYFRHFADKREVLFAGEDEYPAKVARMVAEAPPGLTAMALIAHGLHTMAATAFEGQRARLKARQAVVQSDEGLRERELRKLSAMWEAITDGFQTRGFDNLTATVAARIAVTAFNVAIERWLAAPDDQPLTGFVDETLKSLRSITAEPF
ncbi:TetR/AcrR family transcriptional regulator [Winogradskya humida]|uniref:TetR family transcriptional regulator n=1 Tax=Winogradskya humida TaxID=113566 RepID=A0ABQ3ZQL9_9ACTN|nr:TetR/AcrR family transcriptional regulator [Actinoplanes humidus]GIE20876.1 TetR family transcriptional regulator [Actinoplanes humidus]